MNSYFSGRADDRARLSWQLSISLGILATLFAFALWVANRKKMKRLQNIEEIYWVKGQSHYWFITLLVLSQVTAGLLQGLYTLGQWFFIQFLPRVPHDQLPRIGICATVIAGSLLFIIRWKMRSTYAFLEIGTAIILGGQLASKFRVDDPLDPSFLLTFIPASIYLFVRGADNLHQALVKSDDDLLLRYFIKPFSKKV